jgi:hypothetical protein
MGRAFINVFQHVKAPNQFKNVKPETNVQSSIDGYLFEWDETVEKHQEFRCSGIEIESTTHGLDDHRKFPGYSPLQTFVDRNGRFHYGIYLYLEMFSFTFTRFV